MAKRKRGRPRKNSSEKAVGVSVSLPVSLVMELNERAYDSDTTLSHQVRSLIEQGLEREGRQVKEA